MFCFMYFRARAANIYIYFTYVDFAWICKAVRITRAWEYMQHQHFEVCSTEVKTLRFCRVSDRVTHRGADHIHCSTPHTPHPPHPPFLPPLHTGNLSICFVWLLSHTASLCEKKKLCGSCLEWWVRGCWSLKSTRQEASLWIVHSMVFLSSIEKTPLKRSPQLSQCGVFLGSVRLLSVVFADRSWKRLATPVHACIYSLVVRQRLGFFLICTFIFIASDFLSVP